MVNKKRATKKFTTPLYLPVSHLKQVPSYDHVLLCTILLLISYSYIYAQATSINYGISQQPITDISQLMPSLCQNQSVICEGSFCIPGVRKCVCDLRQPVQLGRFCLRQVDVETKCFATKQCNHTIKDAVCTDLNSNTVLDIDSSMFKLEQWQNLNELRQGSQLIVSGSDSSKQKQTTSSTITTSMKPMFLATGAQNDLGFQTRDDVIVSNVRNSPYEINYYTPELLQQNHTRRKSDNNDKNIIVNLASGISTPNTQNDGSRSTTNDNNIRSSNNYYVQSISSPETTTQHPTSTVEPKTRIPNTQTSSSSTPSSNPTSSTLSTSSLSSEFQKKKMIVKAPTWPPGVCSCPPGHMFDSMLRKCLALSLVDSHCLTDDDCKQIRMTHCSKESKKCECDEPLVWNQTELACVRPKPKVLTMVPEKPAAPLLLSEFLPDQTMILLISAITIIVATLIILGLIVKCFSTKKSALISPKNQKNKKNNQNAVPRSPYASLRKEKPDAQINSFAQATRGRILNYDFEQDNNMDENIATRPASACDRKEQQHSHDNGASEKGGTLSRLKGIKQNLKTSTSPETGIAAQQAKNIPEVNSDEPLDLSELDSETKSEHSILAPPQPTTNQPTYMLAGQHSAIAAAAAAVANRRNFGKPEFV